MTRTPTPEVITRYFTVAAEGNIDALLSCFREDAEVTDEGQTYRGRDAIRRWREAATSKYSYTVEVIDSEAVGEDGHVVTSELEGDFPGSPAQLKFRFSLRGGLIESLEIAP